MLKIKKLTPDAMLPTKGTEGAACFDLYVSEDTVLPIRQGVLVPTGIALEIPEGWCVQVYLRSSMCKKNIVSSTGIIDSDYTGEIKVQAINVGFDVFVLKKGDRIGQMMLVKVTPTDFEVVDKLKDTKRGTNGWGSTGR